MTDNIEPVASTTNLLDEDLSNVDTSMPVIKGPLTAELEIVSVEESASKDGGQNLVIRLKTVKGHVSTKGDNISPGYPLTKWIGLTPVVGRPNKKDYTLDDIKRSLAQFTEAAEGKKSAVKPLDRFRGMRLMAKIGVQPATEQYPNESNSVTFIKRG